MQNHQYLPLPLQGAGLSLFSNYLYTLAFSCLFQFAQLFQLHQDLQYI